MILSLEAELEVMFTVKLLNAFPNKVFSRSDLVGQKMCFLLIQSLYI